MTGPQPGQEMMVFTLWEVAWLMCAALCCAWVLYNAWVWRRVAALPYLPIPAEHSLGESFPARVLNTLFALRIMPRCLDRGLEEVWATWPGKSRAVAILGNVREIVTYDVRCIEHVLKTNFNNYVKGPAFDARFRPVLGKGIFNSDGDLWYRHRKLASHLFKVNTFKTTILSVLHKHARTVRAKLETQIDNDDGDTSPGYGECQMQDLFYRFTLDSIGEIAFGESIGALEGSTKSDFGVHFDFTQQCCNEAFFDPFWALKRYLTPQGWRFWRSVRKINEFALGVVHRRRVEVRSRGPSAGAGGGEDVRGDLLTLFINLEEEFSDQHLRDVVMNFIIAGRDTTAQALSWLFYSLAKHTDVQDRARQEIMEVIGDADEVTYNQLSELQYCQAVAMEVLRLYPSVPKEIKYAVKDDVLPDGTVVPRGSGVVFCPYAMGRMEHFWKNATTFDPDRFYKTQQPSPFVFTAFQAGPRTCLGMRMAYTEIKTVLAMLLPRLRFSLLHKAQTVTYQNSITLPIKGGVKLRFSRIPPVE